MIYELYTSTLGHNIIEYLNSEHTNYLLTLQKLFVYIPIDHEHSSLTQTRKNFFNLKHAMPKTII